MNSYLIKGTSLSLIDRKIDELIKNEKFTEALVTTYDLEEDSILLLMEDADTISFLTPNKVIIGRNFSNNILSSDVISVLNKYLDNPNSNVLLIFTANNLDTRKKIVKELISKLTIINIENSVKELINSNLSDYEVENKVKNLLEEYYQNDIERLINEITKLKIAFLDTKKITYYDAVNLLVKPLNNNDNLVFDLVKYIATKDKKEALITYNELLKYNIESYTLIGLLESQYRLLYQVKILYNKGVSSKEIATILDVHPFRVKKTLELIRFYTLKEVRKFLKRLADIDYKIKSGIYDNNNIIELLILNL